MGSCARQTDHHVLRRIGAAGNGQTGVGARGYGPIVEVEGRAGAIEVAPDDIRGEGSGVQVKRVGVAAGGDIEDHRARIQRPAVEIERRLAGGRYPGQISHRSSEGLPVGNGQRGRSPATRFQPEIRQVGRCQIQGHGAVDMEIRSAAGCGN